MQRTDFTLIELLVAIAILAILAALLLPVLGRAKYQAKLALDANNQRQLVFAYTMYAGDNHGNLPPTIATDDYGGRYWAPPWWINYHADEADRWETSNGGSLHYYLGTYVPTVRLFHCPVVGVDSNAFEDDYHDESSRFTLSSYYLFPGWIGLETGTPALKPKVKMTDAGFTPMVSDMAYYHYPARIYRMSHPFPGSATPEATLHRADPAAFPGWFDADMNTGYADGHVGRWTSAQGSDFDYSMGGNAIKMLLPPPE